MNERIAALSTRGARWARRGARWLVLSLWLASAIGRATASAQDAAATASFDEAINTALSAHARGDYARARAYMERAHALDPSARTLRGLGIIAFSEQRFVQALRFFDQALASEAKPLSAELSASTADLRAQALERLAELHLELEPKTEDVTLDGAVPDWYASDTLVLLPGSHVLRVAAPGRVPHELRLALKPGSRETLRIVLPEVPEPRVVERAVTVPAAPAAPQEAVSYGPAVRYGALAFAGAVALSGASLWAVGRVRLNDLEERCANKPGGGCSDELARHRYEERNIATLRGGAIALLATSLAITSSVAAVELWRWRKRESLQVGASPRHVAVRLRF